MRFENQAIRFIERDSWSGTIICDLIRLRLDAGMSAFNPVSEFLGIVLFGFDNI